MYTHWNGHSGRPSSCTFVGTISRTFFQVTRERKILEVSVDKGMEDGQKITFTGEGDQEPTLEPGDIIIVLDEKEHPLFKRNGTDLIMKMQISLSEALTGFKKTVQTLDNRTLVIQTVSGKLMARAVNEIILLARKGKASRPFCCDFLVFEIPGHLE